MTTSQSETSTIDIGTDTGAENATETEQTTAAAEQTSTTAETPDDRTARLETEIAKLRKENASERVAAKEQAAEAAKNDLLATLTKALGGDTGEKPVTVEELTAQLTEQTNTTTTLQTALNDAQAELVVWRNAADLGVDAAALTDSRAFVAATKDLDPASDTFAEDVKKAAQEAAEKNPKLKAVQATTKSGADLNGGSGEGAVTPEQFKNMSGAERNQLAQTNPTLYARLSGRA